MTDKKQEAADLLNNLIADLKTACKSQEIWEKNLFLETTSEVVRSAVLRMHIVTIVFALSKLREIWRSYNQLFPETERDEYKELIREIDRLPVKKLRNTVAGHINDKKMGRPLTHEEVNGVFQNFISDDLEKFFKWINEDVAVTVKNARDSLV